MDSVRRAGSSRRVCLEPPGRASVATVVGRCRPVNVVRAGPAERRAVRPAGAASNVLIPISVVITISDRKRDIQRHGKKGTENALRNRITEKVPAGQAPQVLSVDEVPSTSCVPGSQSSNHLLHRHAWPFVPDLKAPVTHAEQLPSATAVPAVNSCPGGHVVMAISAQGESSSTAENWPVVHAEQVESASFEVVSA